jgi:hypothetical protein
MMATKLVRLGMFSIPKKMAISALNIRSVSGEMQLTGLN